MMAPFLRHHSSGATLAVRVQPRASKNEIAGVVGGELKIRLTAPPVDSAANLALIEFLAMKLDCPRGAISILRGHASRKKALLVTGLSADDVEAKLGL